MAYNGLYWLLLLILTLCIFVPAAVEGFRRSGNLFGIKNIFLLYVWLQFALWPAWVLLAGRDRLMAIRIKFISELWPEVVPATLLVIAGVITFHFGYYCTPGPLCRRVEQAVARSQRLESYSLLRCAAWLLIVVGIVAALVFLDSVGWTSFLIAMDEFRVTRLLGVGPYYTIVACLYLGAACYAASASVRRQWGPWAWTVILICTVVPMACGFRHLGVGAFATACLVRHYLFKRTSIRPRYVAIGVLFLLFNIVYVHFRSTASVMSLTEISDNLEGVLWQDLFSRFHGTETLVRVMDVMKFNDYAGVLQPVRNIGYSFLPRVLFPSKPISVGVEANVLFFPDNFTGDETGAAVTTLFGNLYWAGGVAYTLAAMAMFGIIARLAESLVGRTRSPLSVVLYCPFVIWYLYLNENLINHTSQMLHHTGALVIFLFIARVITWRPQRIRPCGIGELPRPRSCVLGRDLEVTHQVGRNKGGSILQPR